MFPLKGAAFCQWEQLFLYQLILTPFSVQAIEDNGKNDDDDNDDDVDYVGNDLEAGEVSLCLGM